MGMCLPTLNILSLINTPALGRIWLGKSDEKTSNLGIVINMNRPIKTDLPAIYFTSN
jgi:hypothetical protein